MLSLSFISLLIYAHSYGGVRPVDGFFGSPLVHCAKVRSQAERATMRAHTKMLTREGNISSVVKLASKKERNK